jgi:hypothetical protein
VHLFTPELSQLAAPVKALLHRISRVPYGFFAFRRHQRRAIRTQHRDQIVAFAGKGNPR